MLFCSKCPQTQYIGETKNTLKQRFCQHRSNINKNTGTLVTQHFNQHDHSLSDLRCIAIEKQHTLNHNSRLRRETFWMHKLKTVTPQGLNTLSPGCPPWWVLVTIVWSSRQYTCKRWKLWVYARWENEWITDICLFVCTHYTHVS